MPDDRALRLGVIVNPIAGMGGAVGLKGTDGAAALAEALARGAVAHAGERMSLALRALAALDPGPVQLLAAPGAMGADAVGADAVGADTVGGVDQPARIVGRLADGPTTAADTRRLAAALADAGVDLLLFAGGDGTARDVLDGLDGRGTPVLGIPAGVKMQSAVFAVSPVAAGRAAAAFLGLPPGRRRTAPREVVDLDEEALRAGVIAPRLAGELQVPVDRAVQARKSPPAPGEAGATAGIAAEIAARMRPGDCWILGPGSTLRAVADHVGVPKTLIGFDVVTVAADGAVRLEIADGNEAALLLTLPLNPRLVVTPIGGQGFLFGRGNQQAGPRLLGGILDRRGRDGIVPVATPAKLAGLRGPLLVNTGDDILDARLEGHLPVVTGRGERHMVPVRRA